LSGPPACRLASKSAGRSSKWLLKAAFGDKLPPAILARGKQGFSVPVGSWLRNELRDWAAERLIANRTLDAWFAPEAVRALFDEHCAGRVNHGKRLWALVMLGVWAQ
jgi:asparagine synthase (glutamine-hydrolysing)